MNTILQYLITTLLTVAVQAQSPIGAWEHNYTSEDGTALTSVVIFSDDYQVLTTYETKTGKFIHTNGGSWSLKGNTMTEVVAFNSNQPEKVGDIVSFEIAISDSEIQIVGSGKKLTRLDDGNPGVLQGAWLMSGRIRNGEMQTRDSSRPRKTVKILSGARFQWIAYNTKTKQFMGTGGGTYTTIDGEYTENIEFFSKDNTRVGASLQFNYELKGGNWHHSGLSSKEVPIYEIWSPRK